MGNKKKTKQQQSKHLGVFFNHGMVDAILIICHAGLLGMSGGRWEVFSAGEIWCEYCMLGSGVCLSVCFWLQSSTQC